jgi:hypothetical protein
MAENDVTIQINLDAKDAQVAVELFGKNAEKALQSVEENTKNIERSYKRLASQLENVGKSSLDILRQEQKNRLKIIQDALNNNLITEKEASNQRLKLARDFSDKIKKEIKIDPKEITTNNAEITRSFETAFANITRAGAKIFLVIETIRRVYQLLSGSIGEAVQEAKALKQIEASLSSVGESGESAVRGVIEFAEAIKESTGISDDLVKQTFIIAQSFGISSDRAKELTAAAIDLAAATGQDVDTAVRQLGGTLDGTIGKVGNYGAEFRNLTKEQLEAGAAIDLVNQKFGGSASKDLESFGGRISQLTNSFSDFVKEIGKTVTESSFIQRALKATADAVDGLTEAVKRGRDEQQSQDTSIGASILGASAAYAQAAQNVRLLNEEAAAFRDINVGDQSKKVSNGFRGIVEQAQGATKATSNFLERLNSFPKAKAAESLGVTGKALEDAKKKAEEAAKAYDTLLAKLRTSTADDAAKIKARYDQEIVEIRNVSKEKLFSAQQTATLIALVEKNRVIETNKFLIDEAKKANDELRKQAEEQKSFLEGVFANPFGNLAQRFQDEITRAIEFARSGKDLGSPFKEGEIAASITGGLALALQGKAGAVKAVSQIGEIIGNSFGIPGLGAITELLSRGPEATKKFITEFINSVPDIIQAVAESIPVVVEALVDTLINKGGIVKIAAALVRAMVFSPALARVGELILGKPADELTQGINESFSQGAENWTQATKDFFNNIGPAVGQLLLGIGPGLSDLFKNIWKGLEDSFNRFDEVFNQQWNLFIQSFGGALSGFIQGIGGAFVSFFEQLGPAFESAINNFVNAIGDALSGVFDPLLGYIQRLTESFQRIGNIFTELARAFKDVGALFSDLFGGLSNQLARLTDPIERLIKSLSNPFGGGGGGDGLLAEAASSIGKVLGFSKGGMVYASDGFFSPKGTDTVPAMLTPGELVVPRDMVSELGSFLMRQSSDSPSSDSAMLSAIYSAVSSPMVIKTEAKVNQQAFADIILQLNRQNARLSA